MKIAKLFIGDPNSRKGYFNNVIERCKKIKEIESDVDFFIIRLRYDFFARLLRGSKLNSSYFEDSIVIEDIKFKNIWLDVSVFDYFFSQKTNQSIVLAPNKLKKMVHIFENYDLISCHGLEAIFLANHVHDILRIPYIATWHGSDINVIPFKSSYKLNGIKKLLESAHHNFFVSEKLMLVAKKISSNVSMSVLYTGPSDIFFKYSAEQKKRARTKLNISEDYVVGYIGNLVPIKNVLILPEIFAEIRKYVNANLSFIVIGDGPLQAQLNEKFALLGIDNIHMLGKKLPHEIPDIMNCLNVLLLPSLNEGLPRVTLEAHTCGVHVVGSDRGGIPEAIGIENCFELNSFFIKNAAERVVELLIGSQEQAKLSEKFSWKKALGQEKLVHNMLKNNA